MIKDPFSKPKRKKKKRDEFSRPKRGKRVKVWGGAKPGDEKAWGSEGLGSPPKKSDENKSLTGSVPKKGRGLMSRWMGGKRKDMVTLGRYYNRLDKQAEYNIQAEVADRLEALQQQSDAKLSGGLVQLFERITRKRLSGGQVEEIKRFAYQSRTNDAQSNREALMNAITTTAAARGADIAAAITKLGNFAQRVIGLVTKTGA